MTKTKKSRKVVVTRKYLELLQRKEALLDRMFDAGTLVTVGVGDLKERLRIEKMSDKIVMDDYVVYDHKESK